MDTFNLKLLKLTHNTFLTKTKQNKAKISPPIILTGENSDMKVADGSPVLLTQHTHKNNLKMVTLALCFKTPPSGEFP